MTPEQQQVAELREGLWRNGFRPLAVTTGDKKPIGNNWPERARQNPPECLRWEPVQHAANTGLLMDGLRGIDIDVDDARLARMILDLVVQRLGNAPQRFRSDSPRRCLLYRAADGEPSKRSVVGSRGKIETLGKGQQCLAFGRHPSGAELEWTINPAVEITAADLPVVTEDQITALLDELAPLIGAAVPAKPNGRDSAEKERVAAEPQADISRIAEAMARIPNGGVPDWEWWNKHLMALYAATGGSDEGRKLAHQWSALNPSYDAKATESRWRHYRKSPPERLGAGSIFYAAEEALQSQLDGFLDLGLTEASAEADDASETQDPWARAAEPPPLPELPPEPEWPEPMGREAYRGLLGEIVDATIPTTEADRHAVLFQHLVFFGNAIGIGDTTPWCRGGKVVHRTNLFLLIAGKTAYARKGTSTAEVRFIYQRVDPAWCHNHIRSGLSSGEGLITALRDEAAHIDADGNVVIDHPASMTKNILVIESEFGQPLKNMQRQGNNLADLIKKAWDGGALETMTKNPVRATGHLTSLIAQDTFASLTENMPLVSAQDGFANRIAMVCTKREKLLSNPPDLDPRDIDRFVAGLLAAIRAARLVGEMPKTAKGQAAWDDLYHLLGEEKPGLYGAVVSRGDVQVLRLAMLYALLDQRREIDTEHFQAAYAAWRYCAASASYLFGERQASPLAEKVLDELRHASNGLTRTDLHAAFGRHITKGQLTGALAQLARDGFVRRVLRTTGGRPAEIWVHHSSRARP